MEVQNAISTLKTGTQVFVYIVLASISFICTYPMYKVIRNLFTPGTFLSAVIFVIFWLIAFFVMYMGTSWVMQGKFSE